MLERLSMRKHVGRKSIHFEVSNVNIFYGIALIQLAFCSFHYIDNAFMYTL